MKKYLILVLCLFLLTGCGKKEKIIDCSFNSEVNDIKIVSTYSIFYDDKYVTKIKTNEKMEFSDSNLISKYKKTLESKYSLYKDVKYYNYSIKTDKNTLISTTDINYKKIDIDKLIKIDSDNSSLIKNGKVLVSDVLDVYSQLGIVCKK